MRNRLRSALVLCSGALVAATVLTTGGAFGQKPGSDISRGSDPSREDKADKAAFEGVCGACHPAGMVDDLRSESEWRETVEVMVKAGAKGTDDQFDRLTRFLLRNWTKVNINTATASEIAPVLDVNEATARAIVKRRTESGSFQTIEELKKVPGVNAAKLEARKDRVVF